MRTIEDRLRDAFRADAQTVRPETIRPFVSPGMRPGRPAGNRPRGRVMIPVAAAVAVGLVTVGTVVVLPRVLASHDHSHHAPPSGIATGYPGGRMPSGPPPRFFVAITFSNDRTAATELSVINATTGRITGRITSPGPHRNFQAVAPLGNDRTFVAEASGVRCDSWLYRFTLTAAGKPTGLTPLAVPMVPGRPVGPASLATSADGQLLAFATGRCAGRIKARQIFGHVGVIDLTSLHVTTWSYLFPANPASLSLSADGRLLELVSNPSNGSGGNSIVYNAAWVVRTSAAPGPLAQRYRKLFGPPTWPSATVLSPNGRLTWALQPRYVRAAPRWRVMLTMHQTATGRLLRTWHIFPRQAYLSDPSLSPSVSGRYLLVFGFNYGVEQLDLATGKLTKVPGNNAYLPVDVAW